MKQTKTNISWAFLAQTCLIVLLMVSACPLSAQTPDFYSRGNGTEADPYQLSTVQDLLDLSTEVNAGAFSAGTYFILTEDLDMSEVSNFQPIGTAEHPFNGFFNGDRHSIYHLTMNYPEQDNVGLFGFATEANINNLNLVDAEITGRDTVGGILGEVSMTVTLSTNTVSGTITGRNYVGAVLGYGYYQPRVVENTVTAEVVGLGQYIGGIVGGVHIYAQCSFNIFAGRLRAAQNAACIVGLVKTTSVETSTVSANLSEGTFSASNGSSSNIGAIVGVIDGAEGLRLINNFYDKQMMPGFFGVGGTSADVEGQTTGKLTSECLAYGLKTDDAYEEYRFAENHFTFTADRYPYITNSPDDEISLAAAAPVKLQASSSTEYEAINKIKSAFTVCLEGVVWKSSDTTVFEVGYYGAAPLMADTSVLLIALVDNIPVRYIPLHFASAEEGFHIYGTKPNPIMINSITELNNLRDATNNKTTFKGVSGLNGFYEQYFILTTNLTYSNDWNPIERKWLAVDAWNTSIGCDASHPFRGNFDGHNHVINKFVVFSDGSSSSTTSYPLADYRGLFGYMKDGAVENLHISGGIYARNYVGLMAGYAENVTFDNCSMSVPANNAANQVEASVNYAGGLLGFGKHVAITNTNTNAEVKAASILGGVVGAVSDTSRIFFSNNSGPVTSTSGAAAGGITGVLGLNVGYCLIDHCDNSGLVSGYDFTGGIAGNVNTSSVASLGDDNVTRRDAVIRNVNNYANVSSGKGYTGGIVGAGRGVKIENANFSGKVTATTSYVGGIAGQLSLTTKVDASHPDTCFAELINVTISDSSSVYTEGSYVAGIVGAINVAEINNVTIGHTSINGNSYVGGVVGSGTRMVLKNLTNHADVTATGDYAGGVAAVLQQTTFVDSCYNTGIVDGLSNTGGVIGRVNGPAYVAHCENDGQVTSPGTGNYIGGVIGYIYSYYDATYLGKVTMHDLHNRGTVSSTTNSHVGGVLGRYDGYRNYGNRATNLTNTGDVTGTQYVGGVFGSMLQYARLDSVSNRGNVNALTSSAGGIGGLMTYSSYNRDTLNVAANYGKVSAPSYAAGIVASMSSTNTVYNRDNLIKDVANYGEVESTTGGYAAGLVAYAVSTRLENAVNEAKVTGKGNYVGGLVAYALMNKFTESGVTDTTYVDLIRCTNRGEVYNTGTNYTAGGVGAYDAYGAVIEDVKNYGSVRGLDLTGGLFGTISLFNRSTPLSSDNCYVDENVTVTGRTYVGGLAGSFYYGVIRDYENKAKVLSDDGTGNNFGGSGIGGIVGGVYGQATDTVKFVNLSNRGEVFCPPTVNASGYGGIAGRTERFVILENVANYALVTGPSYVGGIVGYMISGDMKILHARNEGEITSNYGSCVGGIAGYVGDSRYVASRYLSFDDCTNDAKITGFESVGGIAGSARSLTIQNSANSGTITGQNSYVGGIAGYMGGNTLVSTTYPDTTVSNIYHCTNTGEINGALSSGSYVGGVLGYMDIYRATIDDVHNTANVNAGKAGYAGGIVGRMYGSVLQNSTNSGNVAATGNYVGGIIGDMVFKKLGNDTLYSTFVNNQSTATSVSGNTYTGGYVGHATMLSLDHCVNVADVSSTADYVGGIIGYAEQFDTLTYCENKGKVSAANTYAGGLAGSIRTYSYVNNGKNSGTVQATGSYVGGIAGSTESYSLIENLENSGEISSQSTCAGGLTGWLFTYAVMKDGSSSGSVYAKGNYAGGAVGRCQTYSEISDVSNSGDVRTDASYVGGVAGSTESYSEIFNSTNSGNVFANVDYAGGMTGLLSYSKVHDAVNVGRVAAKSNYAGGIVGYSNNSNNNNPQPSVGRIYNVINAGEVSGSASVGGILGYSYNQYNNLGSFVYRALNVGNVKMLVSAVTIGAILGDRSTANVPDSVYQVYFDKQMCPLAMAMSGKQSMLVDAPALTANLLGTALQGKPGFDTDNWLFQDGKYPVPKAVAATSAAILAAQPLTLAVNGEEDYEDVKLVKQNMAIANQDGSSWSTRPDNYVTIDNAAGTAVLNDLSELPSAYDTMTVTLAGETREVILWIEGGQQLTIDSLGDLRNLQIAVNNGYGTYKGVYSENGFKDVVFKVTTDIDMAADDNFEPIGRLNYPFRGTVHGCNHTISNLSINKPSVDADANKYIGLFGYIDGAALDSLHLDSSCVSIGYRYTGSLVGCAINYSRITACSSAATVQSTYYRGGVVGTIASGTRIEGCRFRGTINGDQYYWGGIVYKATNSEILHCVNEAVLTGSFSLGGVVGSISSSKVSYCENRGNVTVSNDITNVAGVVGSADSYSQIDHCINYADVTVSNNLTSIGGGAIVGSLQSSSELFACENYGNVKFGQGGGGIAGGVFTKSQLHDCMNFGTVTGTNSRGYAGGIAGKLGEGSQIHNVANFAPVTGTYYVGGIVGNMYSSAADAPTCLQNAQNVAAVKGTGRVAGIVGYLSADFPVEVDYALNLGTVTATDNYGTIVGQMDNPEQYVLNAIFSDKQRVTKLSSVGSHPDLLPDAQKFTHNLVGTRIQSALSNLDEAGHDHWTFTEDMYPRLTICADTVEMILAATPLYFDTVVRNAAGFESVDRVDSAFGLGTALGVQWSSTNPEIVFNAQRDSAAIRYGECRIDTATMIVSLQGKSLSIPLSFGDMGNDWSRIPIATVEDLLQLDSAVNYKRNMECLVNVDGFAGKHFELVNDLDLSGIESWEPIGWYYDADHNSIFKGYFHGGGHKITGFKIKSKDIVTDKYEGETTSKRKSNSYHGLFGYIENAYIDSLTVSGRVAGSQYNALLAGYAKGSEIRNCQSGLADAVVKDTVLGSSYYAGGIVGAAHSTILAQDTNYADISKADYTGGIAGRLTNSSSLSKVDNYGSIYGTSNTGGIVGLIYTNSPILYAANHGPVSGTTYVGGISGYNYGAATIDSSVNYASVMSRTTTFGASNATYVGGITGCQGVANTAATPMSVLKNYGDVLSHGFYVGGIAGYACRSSINEAENYGNIYSEKSYVGGVVGYFDGEPTVCGKLVNLGTVRSDQYSAGGIYGYGSRLTLMEAINFGKVSGGNYVGGIVGEYATTSNISLSVNYGEIQGNSNVGGIVGSCNATLTNVLSLGAVNPLTTAGGLVGVATQSDWVSHSYFDRQMAGTIDAVSQYPELHTEAARSTVQLLADSIQQLDETFTDEYWVFDSDSTYPRLKFWADSAITQLMVQPFFLQDTESVKNITTYPFYVYDPEHKLQCSTDNPEYIAVNGNVFSRISLPEDTLMVITAQAALTEGERTYVHTMPFKVGNLGALTIDSLADLVAFRDAINTGGDYKGYSASAGFSGMYVDLTTDIDMLPVCSEESGISWTPIGNSARTFNGTLEAHGHTISNLYISKTSNIDNDEYNYQGLFGQVSNGGIVDSLNVSGYVCGRNFVGGLAARVNNHAQLCHCSFTGEVKSFANTQNNWSYCGGLVGYLDQLSRIEHCRTNVKVDGRVSVGGVVGRMKNGAIVEYCQSQGSVTGLYYVGGVVGDGFATQTYPSTIQYCTNAAEVTATSRVAFSNLTLSPVGGILGYGEKYLIIRSNCNIGNVRAVSNAIDGAAGICGVFWNNNDDTISYNLNAGMVYADPNIGMMGGIVGYNYGVNKVNNNIALSNVLSVNTSQSLGGVVGYENSSVKNFQYNRFNMQYCPFPTVGNNNTSESARMADALTSELVGDALLNQQVEGFDEENWVFNEGMYPMPKGIDTTTIAKLAATPIFLYENGSHTDYSNTVRHSFAITPMAVDVPVTYTNSLEGLYIENDSIKIDHLVGDSPYIDTLTMSAGGFSKQVVLTIYPPTMPSEYLLTIDSVEDLVNFRDAVNNATTYKGFSAAQGFSGLSILVTTDIDMSSVCGGVYGSWEPIGTMSRPFKGVLNGNNKTFSNLFVKNTATSYQGLFGVVNGCHIDSLNVEGTIEGKDYVGLLAGLAQNRADFCNCTVSGSVESKLSTASNFVSGMVGRMYHSTIHGGVNKATVKGLHNYIGGLVGYMNEGSGLYDCVNEGEVQGVDYTGGLVGDAYTESVIDHCQNKANVQGDDYVGGITGYLYTDSRIADCQNEASAVTGSTYTAGVAGYARQSEIRHCENKAEVSSNKYTVATYTNSVYVAGIAAMAEYATTIDSCANYGNITVSAGQYTGGIVGYGNYAPVVYDCVNYGVVTNQRGERIGGIVGSLYGGANNDKDNYGDVAIWNCENHGKVMANGAYTGGVVGSVTGSTWKRSSEPLLYDTTWVSIKDCFNDGQVTNGLERNAGYNYTSGVVGYVSLCKDTVSRCINSGDVSSLGAYTAGVVGYATTLSPVAECVNTGKIRNTGAVNYVGGVVGMGTILSPVSGCRNEGPVFARGSYVGGVVGNLEQGSSITYCDNYGPVLDTMITGSSYLNRGGVVGSVYSNYYNEVEISHCHNYAPVRLNASAQTGGIVGRVEGSRRENKEGSVVVSVDTFLVRIDSCTNHGIVSTYSGDNLGGVIGYGNYIAALTDLTNYGDSVISVANSVGGIAGGINRCYFADSLTNNAVVQTTKGYNAGGISAYFDNNDKDHRLVMKHLRNNNQVYASSYSVGGIAGYVNGFVTADSLSNYGEISSASYSVGGIFGRMGETSGYDTLRRSVNYGGVAGTDRIAGIVGVSMGRYDAYINGDYYNAKYNYIDSCTNHGLVSGNSYVGGIVANATATTINHSENLCDTVSAKSNYVGGMVGYARANEYIKAGLQEDTVHTNILNCRNTATIIGLGGSNTTNNGCGGIAGRLDDYAGVVDSCVNEGRIEGFAAVGGIAGYVSGDTIRNCENKANVNAQKDYAGGLFGVLTSTTKGDKIYASTIDKVDFLADTVHGLNRVGGIVGYAYKHTMRNYVVPDITVIADASYAGGYAGYMEYDCHLDSIVNFAKVTATADYAGGIAGYFIGVVNSLDNWSYLHRCLNRGAITGLSYVGGIVGLQNSADIDTCVNYGNVVGSGDYAGGIVGVMSSSNKPSRLAYCLNVGSVENFNLNSGLYVGGIAGCMSNKAANTMEYVINNAVVRGTNYVSGIVGYRNDSDTIRYALNVGHVTTKTADTDPYEPRAANGSGLFGGVATSPGRVYDNYFDWQMSAENEATNAKVAGWPEAKKNTRQLVADSLNKGTSGAGWTEENFVFTENRYPQLKALAEWDATKTMSKLAATPIYLQAVDGSHDNVEQVGNEIEQHYMHLLNDGNYWQHLTNNHYNEFECRVEHHDMPGVIDSTEILCQFTKMQILVMRDTLEDEELFVNLWLGRNPETTRINYDTICYSSLPMTYGDITFERSDFDTIKAYSGEVMKYHFYNCDSVIVYFVECHGIHTYTDSITLCANKEFKTSWWLPGGATIISDGDMPAGNGGSGHTYDYEYTLRKDTVFSGKDFDSTQYNKWIHYENVLVPSSRGCDSITDFYLYVHPAYANKEVIDVCAQAVPFKYAGATFLEPYSGWATDAAIKTKECDCDSVVGVYANFIDYVTHQPYSSDTVCLGTYYVNDGWEINTADSASMQEPGTYEFHRMEYTHEVYDKVPREDIPGCVYCDSVVNFKLTLTVPTLTPNVPSLADDTTIYYNSAQCQYTEVALLTEADFTVEYPQYGEFSVEHSDTTNNGEGCEWKYLRTYVWTDSCGNRSTVKQYITVKDTMRPTLASATWEDSTVYMTAYSDNCDLFTLPTPYTTVKEVNDAFGSAFITDCNIDDDQTVTHTDEDVDTHTCDRYILRTYHVNDSCGNGPAVFTHKIWVKDTVKPILEGTLNDLTVYLAADCGITLPDPYTTTAELLANGLTAVKDCNSSLTVTKTDVQDNNNTCDRFYVRTYKVTDDCGNFSTTDQIIHVLDTVKPKFNTIAAQDATPAGNCQYAVPNLQVVTMAAVISDCNGQSFVGQDIAAGTAYDQADTVRTIPVVVTVKDSCGNENTTTINVKIPAKVSISNVEVTEISCRGNDGAIDITPADGTVPYTYLWSSGETTQNISGLSVEGEYTVTVTDANGCQTDSSAEMTKLPELQLTDGTTPNKPVTCFGDSNGELYVSAVGGASPYTYLWSNGSADSAQTNLAAGNYSVTVTDSRACTASKVLTVHAPASALQLSGVSKTDAVCYGAADGTVTATVSGGWTTAPYTITIGTRTTSSTGEISIEGLSAGSYTLQAADFYGCKVQESVTIGQSEQLTASFTNPTGCPNQDIYNVQVNIENATEPLASVVWTGATVDAEDMTKAVVSKYGTTDCDHTYNMSITATDAHGCVVSADNSFVLADSVKPVITGTIPAQTFNGCAASDLATLYPAQTTVSGLLTTFTGLTITDNCSSVENMQLAYEDTPNGTCPIVVTRTYTVTDQCGNFSQVSQTINVQDTVKPVVSGVQAAVAADVDGSCQYTIPDVTALVRAKASDNCTETASLTITQTPAAGTAITAQGTAEDVTYSVKDACNNEVTGTISVTSPEPISLSMSHTDETCVGGNGTATVVATKGHPSVIGYGYSWNTTPVQSAATAMQLTAGTYTVTVTDVDGCTQTGSVTITLTNPYEGITESYTADPICSGGRFAVIPTGMPDNTTYSWAAPTGNVGGLIAESNQTDIHGTLTNSTSAQQSVTYTVTPKTGVCVGSDFTVSIGVDVTVNPEVLVTPVNLTICPNTNDTLKANLAQVYSKYDLSWNFNGSVIGTASNQPVPSSNDTTVKQFLNMGSLTNCNAVYPFTLSYTDESGCRNTQSGTVTVKIPEWSITAEPDTAVVYCVNDIVAPHTITPSVMPVVKDGCERTLNYGTPDVTSVGTDCDKWITYTYTYTACDNTTDTWSYVYRVIDTIKPVIARTYNRVVAANTTSNCSYVVPDFTTTIRSLSTDNCTAQTSLQLSQSPAAGTQIVLTAVADTTVVTVSVKDACNNVDTAQIRVTTPAMPAVEVTYTSSNCYEGNDGVVKGSVSGGTAPYTLQLIGNTGGYKNMAAAGDFEFDNVADGSYTLLLTDAKGCTSTTEAEVKRNEKVLTVTANSNTWTYDGTAHTEQTFIVNYDGVTSDTLQIGDTYTLSNNDVVSATVTGSITTVTASPVENVLTGVVVTRGTDDVSCEYNIAKENGTLTVIPRDLTIKLDTSKVYDGAVIVSEYATSNHSYTITGLQNGATVTAGTVTTSDAEVDTYTDSSETAAATITVPFATSDDIGNYNVTYDFRQEITKASCITLTCPTGEAITKVYDATALQPAATASTPIEGDVIKVEYKTATTDWAETAPALTDVGTEAVDVRATNPNYDTATCSYTLTVTKRPITVTARDTSFYYDGLAHNASQMSTPRYIINDSTQLVTGHNLDAAVTSTDQTDLGSTSTVVGEVTITDAGGTNVTTNYDITKVNGTLKVEGYPLKLTISSESHRFDCYNKGQKYEHYTVKYGETTCDAVEGSDYKFVLAPVTGIHDTLAITPTCAGTTSAGLSDSVKNTFTYVLQNNIQYVGTRDTVYGYLRQPDTLTLTLTSDDPVCEDGSVMSFTTGGNGGNKFHLSTAAATDSTTHGIYNGLSAGAYTVSVTDSKGCTATQSVTLTAVEATPIEGITRGGEITSYAPDTTVNASGDRTDFPSLTASGDIIAQPALSNCTATVTGHKVSVSVNVDAIGAAPVLELEVATDDSFSSSTPMYTHKVVLTATGVQSHDFENLPAGTYYVRAKLYNCSGAITSEVKTVTINN